VACSSNPSTSDHLAGNMTPPCRHGPRPESPSPATARGRECGGAAPRRRRSLAGAAVRPGSWPCTPASAQGRGVWTACPRCPFRGLPSSSLEFRPLRFLLPFRPPSPNNTRSPTFLPTFLRPGTRSSTFPAAARGATAPRRRLAPPRGRHTHPEYRGFGGGDRGLAPRYFLKTTGFVLASRDRGLKTL
jgi:hypothetical protein